jgi:hypothetical protein
VNRIPERQWSLFREDGFADFTLLPLNLLEGEIHRTEGLKFGDAFGRVDARYLCWRDKLTQASQFPLWPLLMMKSIAFD